MIGNRWDELLKDEYKKEYFIELQTRINQEYNSHEIYPPKELIYNAFLNTDFDNVKVVILGQDPYHGKGEAHGLSFSVGKDIKIPPSLRNIYKELNDDLGYDIPTHGNLIKWAQEGVLLLNTILTVKKDNALSHKSYGWEQFTEKIIEILNDKEEPIVFILWGNFAKSKKKLITNDNHMIIESAHPSPLSARRGFFGSKPFSKSNEFLISKGIKSIDWEIK